MKRYCYLLLLCFSIIAGCDDREQSLQLLNEPPVVSFTKNAVEVTELKDSLRLISGESNPYNILLNVKDDNKNVQFVNWEITKGDYNLYFQGKQVKLPNSFRNEYEKMVINFFPQSLGTYAALFRATDRFGRQATGTFELYVFDNLVPVSRLKVTETGKYKNEYLIDGSESYDPDKNFKGGITYYEFSIDGTTLKLKNSTLKNVFETGTHEITLKVFDNSGAVSDKSTFTLTIK